MSNLVDAMCLTRTLGPKDIYEDVEVLDSIGATCKAGQKFASDNSTWTIFADAIGLPLSNREPYRVQVQKAVQALGRKQVFFFGPQAVKKAGFKPTTSEFRIARDRVTGYLIQNYRPQGFFNYIGQFAIVSASLNIRYLSLQNVPNLSGCASLQILDLSGNWIREIPREIKELTTLKKLNLSDNQIETLPEEFGELTRLSELNLSQNKLQGLPSSLGKCKVLHTLNVQKNRLQNWPQVMKCLPGLEQLNLSHNQLKEATIEVGQNLKSLFLNNNQLKRVEFVVPSFSVLKRLNLANNHLFSVPSLESFPILSNLLLNNNQLTKIPEVSSKYLCWIIVRDNPLSNLPNWNELPKLKRLDIRNTKLPLIPQVPEGRELTLLHVDERKGKRKKEADLESDPKRQKPPSSSED